MTAPFPEAVRHVVLDRDGVLNREGGAPVGRPADWTWETGAVDGLRALGVMGCTVSVVTNQSAVGRGDLARADVDALHSWLRDEISALGPRVAGIHVCPHSPEAGCHCRKPSPTLVRRAIRHAGMAASRTVMVGDDLTDLAAGRGAGAGAILVRTGKGRLVEAMAPSPTVVLDDLLAVAAHLDRSGPPPA